MTKSWRTRIAVVFSLIALLTLLNGVAQATSGEVQWNAVIDLSFTPAQLARPGWADQATSLQNALSARVAARGVSFDAKKQSRADGSLDYVVSLAGTKDIGQFKQVMFDDINPLGGMLGGPISLTLSGNVNQGEEVPIVLESNVASGSDWELVQAEGARLSGSSDLEFTSKGMLLGAAMKQTVRMVGVAAGRAQLTLAYHRPWGKSSGPSRTISLTAARLSMLADLSDPAPVQSAPAALNHSASPSLRTAAATPPTEWDWRAHNGTPPIRDQGNCGSCWAFGTLGPFESALMIQGGLTPQDLSEQFLISCNKEGWGCNGGWWGHDYHLPSTDPSAVLGKNQTTTGGVMDSALPYNPGAVCPLSALPHPYKIGDWAYVNPASPMSIPTTDAIKSAIYNHGPVAASLCVGGAFQRYGGGVFNTDERSTCGTNKVNHAIVLVGWNDSNNTWILRNSWGTGWGESGYMEIVRGVSNVGFAANYVDYPATPGCYSLSVGPNSLAGGTVKVDTAPNCTNGTQYKSGTTVTLTATPNSGYTFSGWSGDVTALTNSVTVTMNGNTNIVANFTSSMRTVQENDPVVKYDGWRGVVDPQANGGSYRVSNIANDKATFRFNGTSVKWITRKGPDQGKAKVLIDGVAKGTFDLFSSTPAPKTLLNFAGLASRAHTLVIQVLGTQNPSSKDHNVVVDGFIVGSGTSQENASTVQYDTWTGTLNKNASGGSYRSSRTKGATVTFTFSGASISWIMGTCPACGQAEIFIDGVDRDMIDTYSALSLKYSASKPYSLLEPGTHTIQIRVLGTKNPKSTGTRINVDAFQYSAQ